MTARCLVTQVPRILWDTRHLGYETVRGKSCSTSYDKQRRCGGSSIYRTAARFLTVGASGHSVGPIHLVQACSERHSSLSRKIRPSGGSTSCPTFIRGRTEPNSSREPAGIVTTPHLPTAVVSTTTVASSIPARKRRTDSGNIGLSSRFTHMARRFRLVFMNITVQASELEWSDLYTKIKLSRTGGGLCFCFWTRIQRPKKRSWFRQLPSRK